MAFFHTSQHTERMCINLESKSGFVLLCSVHDFPVFFFHSMISNWRDSFTPQADVFCLKVSERSTELMVHFCDKVCDEQLKLQNITWKWTALLGEPVVYVHKLGCNERWHIITLLRCYWNWTKTHVGGCGGKTHSSNSACTIHLTYAHVYNKRVSHQCNVMAGTHFHCTIKITTCTEASKCIAHA